jgi:hypothetical protein
MQQVSSVKDAQLALVTGPPPAGPANDDSCGGI